MSKAAAGAEATRQPAAATAAKAALRPREARQARFALSFSQIIAVLMRDPNFRNMRLADLEWLVIPAVMSGQFRLAQMPAPQGKTEGQASGKGQDNSGVLIPVAVTLWARVSDAMDKTLSSNLDKEMRLRPTDWASGDNVWLMAVAGDKRAVPKFLEQLHEKEFKGKPVRMRVRGPDGKVVVKTLGKPGAKG